MTSPAAGSWRTGAETAVSPYRLPDLTFWALVAASVLFCLVHAARRSLGRAAASHSAAVAAGRHSAFQRFFHWANAVTVAVLLASGLATYGAPSLGDLGPTTAFWFSWHLWVAPVFAALIVAHALYEYRAPGHLDEMWPGGAGPGKYDRAQIVFHWAVALNLAALVASGAVLWKPLRALLPLRLFGLGWDFVFVNRVLHGLFTGTLVALVLAHVYFALLVRESWPRLSSMLLGSRGSR